MLSTNAIYEFRGRVTKFSIELSVQTVLKNASAAMIALILSLHNFWPHFNCHERHRRTLQSQCLTQYCLRKVFDGVACLANGIASLMNGIAKLFSLNVCLNIVAARFLTALQASRTASQSSSVSMYDLKSVLQSF